MVLNSVRNMSCTVFVWITKKTWFYHFTLSHSYFYFTCPVQILSQIQNFMKYFCKNAKEIKHSSCTTWPQTTTKYSKHLWANIADGVGDWVYTVVSEQSGALATGQHFTLSLTAQYFNLLYKSAIVWNNISKEKQSPSTTVFEVGIVPFHVCTDTLLNTYHVNNHLLFFP